MSDTTPDSPHAGTITFRRDAFYTLMGELALPPWTDVDGTLLGTEIDCAPLSAKIIERAEAVAFDTDLLSKLEAAWVIIANAGEGDWMSQTDEWRAAAERWRDSYHHCLDQLVRS